MKTARGFGLDCMYVPTLLIVHVLPGLSCELSYSLSFTTVSYSVWASSEAFPFSLEQCVYSTVVEELLSSCVPGVSVVV